MEMVDMVITKIWLRKHFFPAAGFGTSMGFQPPGQPSMLSTPWKPYHETYFI